MALPSGLAQLALLALLLLAGAASSNTGRFVTDTILTMTKPPAESTSMYTAAANQVPAAGTPADAGQPKEHGAAEAKPTVGRLKVSAIVKDMMKPKRKRNIGITISIRPNETSVWTNGAKQNAFFMYQVYTHNNRNNVFLINLHYGSRSDLSFDWNVNGIEIFSLDEALQKDLDVVVESGMQISTEQMHRMQRMGIKVASFRTGNDYFMIAEETIFQRPVSTMFMTLEYDALWTLPAYDFIMDWQSTMFRAPIEKVPYVWSPFFHDVIAAMSKERPKYTPRDKQKAISIFEPNLYIVKNFVMPLALVEAFYRKHKSSVKEVHVLNADKFQTEVFPAFDAFTGVLDVVKDNRTQFLPRYRIPWFLASNGDVVLSHQMHNDLNFLYLDALYAHYPLVHNSPYFKDCGYYYEANNFTQGVAALERAFFEHDSHIEEYNKMADACVDKWSVFHPDNIAGYDRLVDNILALPHKFPQRP